MFSSHCLRRVELSISPRIRRLNPRTARPELLWLSLEPARIEPYGAGHPERGTPLLECRLAGKILRSDATYVPCVQRGRARFPLQRDRRHRPNWPVLGECVLKARSRRRRMYPERRLQRLPGQLSHPPGRAAPLVNALVATGGVLCWARACSGCFYSTGLRSQLKPCSIRNFFTWSRHVAHTWEWLSI